MKIRLIRQKCFMERQTQENMHSTTNEDVTKNYEQFPPFFTQNRN